MPEDQNQQPQTFNPTGPTPPQPPMPQPGQEPAVVTPGMVQPQMVAPVAPTPFGGPAGPAPQAPLPPQPPAPGVVPGPMQPQAPVMPAAPMFGQPQSPLGGAFAPNPSIPAGPGAFGGSRKTGLYVKLGLVGSVVIIAIVAAVVLVLGQGVTKADVTAAEKTLSSIDTDLSDASLASSDLEVATSGTAITTDANTITSKLNDAQTQYNKLKHSKVLNDSNVKSKFKAVDAKWSTYISFEKGNANDLQTIAPILSEVESKQQAVTSPTSLSGVGPYLASLKAIYDTASSKLDATKMSVPENQQVVDAFKTFLQASSTAIATAQADLASGKSGSTVQEDLFVIDDAESTFSSAQEKSTSALTKKEHQLNPDSEFLDLTTALSKLYQTAK